MNSNQYSNNYGYNNQPAGKHNLPPIAAISSAVNYRATAARSHRPSDNTTLTGYPGQTQQAAYNQSSSFAESSSPVYQYNNAGYTSNPATSYPEQQTNNFNTSYQRPVDPPSNSQPSYLVPQPIKANAATYSDSRFAMFPEPNSQKHLDNYIKPSSHNYNYSLPNFKDLTSSYSQQQYTSQSQASKQSNPMLKSNETVKFPSAYSGASQMQVSDWLNKSEYHQNQIHSGKHKTNETTDFYSKKTPSMSASAAPSFQPMEAKSPYQSSSGQNYSYVQGQNDAKTLSTDYRASNSNSGGGPYQMFSSDSSLQRDPDGFKVPQQMQNMPDFSAKTGNTFLNSAQVNPSSSSGSYLPEANKNTQKESRKSFPEQSENYKGSKPPTRYSYAEHKRTDSLPNISQYEYKMNDRIQPIVSQSSNPSMKQSYSLNNLNTTAMLDNRYPGEQVSSNPPLDNRMSSYGSSDSLHSSYISKELNIVDPRYSHPGATNQNPNSKTMDNRNHQSFQNMGYNNYQKSSNFIDQAGKASVSLDHRLPNVSNNPDLKHKDSAMYASGYPSTGSKPVNSDVQMKNSYPLSSFISDKFNSMSASNNFQVRDDSKLLQQQRQQQQQQHQQQQQQQQQQSTVSQNSYNFNAQQYPRPQHQPNDVDMNRSYYPQQQSDMTSGRLPSIRSSMSPSQTRLQSPQNVTSYSKEILNQIPQNNCESPRTSVLTSPLNNLSNPSSQYKIPPSPKGQATPQSSISPKGSISNSPHSMVPLSPYSSNPSPPVHSLYGSQHYLAPSPQNSLPKSPANPSNSPHTSIPPSPYHSSPSPSLQVPPSPSPHQTSRPPSAHQILPSPSPHHTSLPQSPSPHQSSRPPSAHQIPPSPQSHQNSRPPSAHQLPVSLNQTFTPPSPRQNSRPPSSHLVPSSPHQISIPALSHQIPSSSSVPPSPSSQPSSVAISPQQTIPSSQQEKSSNPNSAPSAEEPLDSSTPTKAQSLHCSATSTSDSLSTDPVSLESVEIRSTELKTENQQPSTSELCPSVQLSVPENSVISKNSSCSNSMSQNPIENVISSDLEKCNETPSIEFPTQLSLKRPDSISPKPISTLNEISDISTTEDVVVHKEPERLKTPELGHIEPESIESVGHEIKEPMLCSLENKEHETISNDKHEGDISNNNDEKYKRQKSGEDRSSSIHCDPNNSKNVNPHIDMKNIVSSALDNSSKERTCDIKQNIEEENRDRDDSLVPADTSKIEKTENITESKLDDESKVNSNYSIDTFNNKSSTEINTTLTVEPMIESKFSEKLTQEGDTSLKEENIVKNSEKNKHIPTVLEESNLSEQKNQGNHIVNDTFTQDKENHNENVQSVINIDPSEQVTPQSKAHCDATKVNDMIQPVMECPEIKSDPENGQIVSRQTLDNSFKDDEKVRMLAEKKELNLKTGTDDEIINESNGVCDNTSRANNPVEESSKFYKANIIQSHINRLKDQRYKSVIENISNQSMRPVDDSCSREVIATKKTIEEPPPETRLKRSPDVVLSEEKEISSSKTKINHYMNIHHSETTKILEHVAATLENHKRQLNYVSDSSDQNEIEHRKEVYVENSIPIDTSREVIDKVSKTDNGGAVSYKISHENIATSSRKEEPQNLCVERNFSKDTLLPESNIRTNKDKLLHIDVAPTKNRSPHYFSPKDRIILNYEHQMSIQAKGNELKQTQPVAHEYPQNLGERNKELNVHKVESSKSILSEHSKHKPAQHLPQHVQNEKADPAKPLSNYEMYMKQLLSTSLEHKSLKNSDHNDKIKSTTVIPGIDQGPPPAHSMRDTSYNHAKQKSLSLPQASLNFQSKDLGLSQVQAAEKYKDIQFKQYYEQQQKYNDYERFIMKQSAESSNHVSIKGRGSDLGNSSNMPPKKESKPVKKQSRGSDKNYDSTSSRMSLQDQQKEYLKLLQKQQYLQYNPKSTPEKQHHVDQYKYQNYVQHLAQEEVIREKKRQQASDQRLAFQTYQEQQKYELEQLQLKQQAQLQNQHRTQQDLQYCPRQAPLPSKALSIQGLPTSSSRSKELSQQKPYAMPNSHKKETRPDALHQYPLQYDLTQHIKSQDYQHHQALYNQRVLDQQNKSSRQSNEILAQQYHQSQQQLAENMRRYQQSQQKNDQSRAHFGQEATRVTSEKQKSQPVKKRQYNPAAQTPPSAVPPQNTQVASVSSTARGTIASPLDLSVKTVRQSADSTAKDEEGHRVVSSSVPKLDISPNFTNQQLMSSMFSAYSATHPAQPAPHKKQKKAMAVSPRTAQPAQSPYEAVRREPAQQRYMGSAPGSHAQMHSPASTVQRMPSPSSTNTLATLRYSSSTTSNFHGMDPSHATGYNPYSNYAPQNSAPPKVNQQPAKRPPTDINAISPVPSKFPKVDSWRQTIDFQIDQRLAQAQQQLQQSHGVDKPSPQVPPGHKAPQPPYSESQPGHPLARADPHARGPPPPHPQDLQKSLHIVTSQPSSLPPNHPSPSFLQNQQLLLQKQQAFNQHALQQQRQHYMPYPRPAVPSEPDQTPVTQSHKTPVSKEPSDLAYAFPPQPSPGRQNLPPFNAISFDKGSFMSRRTEADPTPGEPSPLGPKLTSYDHMFHGMPTVDNIKSAELDNVLAARIRTKAELKQNEPKTQLPGASPNDKGPPKAVSPIRADLPPKVAKENQQTIPLRKSRTEEEQRALARGMGVRSSSETSIFDFRDSDSEEERVRPAGGQQSLHEMRRDRKPPRASPPSPRSSPSPSPTPTPPPLHIVDHVNVYEEDAEPVEEAAWDNMFSDFVTYLEKKPKNLFKKARQKQQSPKQAKKREVGYAYVPVPYEPPVLDPPPEKPTERRVKVEDAKKDELASKVVVKEEMSSDSEEEVKRVPKLSLKLRRPVLDDSSSDEDMSKTISRPRAKVKKEVQAMPSSSSASLSEAESSSESEEEEDDDEEEEEQPVITKQLRSRCVGKESQKPEPKMSLRSRDPIVKLTRLEDVSKLSYAVKSEEPPAAIKEKRGKRQPAPVETIRSSKRRKQEDVKEEVEQEIKKEERSLRKSKGGEVKVKTEEKTEKIKSKGETKAATPDAKASESEGTPSKRSARQSERSKKQKAGEGEVEEKRPGWEEELYAFKRSLRMPASLIKITTPPGWPKPRPSASLPDLDSRSASPLTCDSFDMSEEKKEEKQAGDHKTSFLNQLAQRYGATKRGKGKRKAEEGKCRLIPQGGQGPRLLSPHVEESPPPGGKRTRTEWRQDTIRRVFGDDRPASAPPASLPAPTPAPAVPPSVQGQEPGSKKKKKGDLVGRGKKKLGVVSRTGLRSATKLRSNKVLLQRQRVQKKRRSSQSNGSKALNLGQNCQLNQRGQGGPGGQGLSRKLNKMKTMRRKFRSSGFDYIRKKKKKKHHSKRHLLEEDLHKKMRMTMHSLGDTVEDVGSEIRSWVINKHHGETPLHRAARLGYIDAVAYCLEKSSHGPAPKDNAGYTPLHEAASHGWLDIARLLLMYGADPSDSALGGIRPLHDAAEKGCVEMVRLLLSYGADPLLASYAGLTPLSLTSDEATLKLLQYHLADVRGEQAPRWDFAGPASCFDKQVVGYEPLAKVHTKHLEPPPDLADIEIEASDTPLPPLYSIRCEPQGGRYMLFSDLAPLLRPPRTKDALARSLGQSPAHLYREMKLAEFTELVRCTSLGGAGVQGRTKVTLVPYSEALRQLLGIETVTISTV